MKRFSEQLCCRLCSQADLGHCALCSVAMKKPRQCWGFQDRVNPSVRYSYWSPGLYGTPRRLYGSGILEPSKTMRILKPTSKINPIHFTVPSVRVFEAENRLTLGHLLCTKTREVRAKEFKEERKQEKKIVNEEIAENKDNKEEEEKEEEGEENKARGKEKGEEKEEAEEEEEKEKRKKEVEVEKKKEVLEEEEDKEEEQERQEDGDKVKGEKERWWPLQETDRQDHRRKWIPGSHVQGATPRTVATTAEMVSIRQTYRPQEGSQPHQDSQSHLDVNAQVYPRKLSSGFSRSSPHADSTASCATLQESSPKREVELTGLPGFELTGRLGFTPLQEPQQEKLGRKPQAAVPRSPAIPLTATKKPCKRKGAILELRFPPSRPPPPSAILRLLCDQRDLPPPPKIPRMDKQRVLDIKKKKKHRAILNSDGKVDVFQPKIQVVTAGTAPQPVLPRPPSASVPPVSGVSSLVHPASTPLLCQAAGPRIPSAPSPSLTPSIPIIPVSPSAFPSDSLLPCQAAPCVETPSDARKKDPTDVATAPAICHLPRPAEASSFNPSSCGRDATVSVCTASHPPLPFSAAPLSPSPREPPTVFPTSASHDCEDMCQEPSPWLEEMDMDTTPPSEVVTLSSPIVHSMAATTPSSDDKDVEFMDTTPPSKAAIFHSSPDTVLLASNSLNTWTMWRSTTPCHSSRVQSTCTQPNVLPSNGRALISKQSPATAVVGFPSPSVSGSKTRYAGSTSPADRGRPSGTRQANEKRPPASYIAKSILGDALKTGMGTRQCSSSSTNLTPSTATSVRPVVPVSGDNHSHGMATQRYAPSNASTGGKKGSAGTFS